MLGHRPLHRLRKLHVLDLDGGHLDAPALRVLIDDALHLAVDDLSVAEHLVQLGLPQHIAQGRLGDLDRGAIVIQHLVDGVGRAHDVEVHDRTHFDGDVVPRDAFLRRKLDGDDTQIDLACPADHRHDPEQPGPSRTRQSAQHEHYRALILVDDAQPRDDEEPNNDHQNDKARSARA